MSQKVSVGSLEAYLGLDNSEFVQGIKSAQSSLRDVGKSMQNVGRSMTTFITLPLLAVGTGAIKASMDFEKAFSEIEGLVGVAREEVMMMRKEVLAMAGETSRAPQELAEALYFVTSAGFKGAEALEVVRQSAKAAAAGLGETQSIADLVSSAVNAYGKENLSAATATDILVAAVREGKAEAPAMATALGYVLPIASQMGVEFEEVAAAVAAMTRTGTDASTATTNLRQMLSDLLSPTKGAKMAMEGWGTSAAELRKVLKEDGLLAVLGMFKNEMVSNDEAMSEVFGNVRSLSGALDLMGENATENAQVFANLKNTTGDLNKAFDTAANSSTFKFNQGMAQLKTAGIELGAALLPIFLDFVDLIRSAASWFTGLSSSSKQFLLVMAGLAAVLGPALMVLGTMATIFAAISIEVIAVVAAIAALAAGLIYIVENWEAIKERISDWDWWRNVLIDMAQFFIDYNPMVFGGRLMLKAMNWVVVKITEGLNFLIDQFNTFSGILGGAIGEIDNLKSSFEFVDPFEVMTSGLENLKAETKVYKTEFKGFTESLLSFAEKAKTALGDLFPKGGGGSGGGTGAGGEGRTNAAVESKTFKPKETVWYGSAGVMAAKDAVIELDGALKDMIATTFVEFAAGLAGIFTGQTSFASFLSGILTMVADFGVQFGKQLIVAGIAALAFEKLMVNPAVAVAAGFALVIASTAIKGLLAKGPGGGGGSPQGLAVGGFVTQGGVFQLHKDELVSLPNGSAVTPAGTAQMGGGGGLLTAEFNLRNFIIRLDQERQRMNR